MGLSSLFRKKPKHPATERDADFPELTGQHYIEFLGRLHDLRSPSIYLEVGTQKGRSLVKAHCPSIAIDPEFQLDTEVVKSKPWLHMAQMTSDDFFASGYLERNEIKIDFAFLDGMHLFEYLLRDVMNAEAHSVPGGLLALHDCVPFARVMAKRDWDKSVTRSWTGDVWKLLPILRSYRPDLKVEVVDCAPTGLVLIRNLDPESKCLREAYDDILATYMDLELEDYGIEKFVSELSLVTAETYSEGADG